MGDVAELADQFGRQLVSGDFNADVRSDLAVGSFGESAGAVPGAGLVQVATG